MSSIIMVARDVDDLVENSIEDYVNLTQSTADGQTFEGINFGLITSYMQDAKYTDCLFRECAFPGLHMEHAKFDNSEFIDCRFDLTRLDDASFRNSSFRGGDVYLGSASMACADFTYSNLASVDLSRAYAPGSLFAECDLDKTNFSGSNLRGASFARADARGSDFTSADLRGANFFRADLRGANFTGADLCGARFRSALLDGAQFDEAIMDDLTTLPGEYRPRS